MNFTKPVLSFLTILIYYPFLTGAQSADLTGVDKCRNNGNFTANRLFKNNLETALSYLSSNISLHNGFYNSSVGESPNIANAIAFCRLDIDQQTCQNCVTREIPVLRQNCPNQKEAIRWSSDCMVHYSAGTIFGVADNWAWVNISGKEQVANVDEFNKALRNLTNRLLVEAAGGQSLGKFAAGNITVGSDSKIIYGLTQCTPDLPNSKCIECLVDALRGIEDCCIGRVRARIFSPNCYLRYSDVHFYNETTAIAQVPTPSTSTSGKKRKSQKIIKVVVPVACVSLGIFGIGLWFLLTKVRQKDSDSKIERGSSISFLLRKEKQSQTSSTDETVGMEITTVQSFQYGLGTIKGATNSFSPKNKIGKGGFGPVYKGVLPDGQEIAVKRLSESSGQGAEEFVNEAVLVAKLQHRNLVKLLGFCHEANEKLLIYEYVPNKSLDYFLFDPVKHGHLDWQTRYKIIGAITRGMLYLHEDSRLRIIHRDLKASNILLDQHMNAKISDFGLARIFGVDQTQGNTMKIAGTLGYMSPEYAMHGHFSVKSDVFSFGVIILEIVSGKRNSNFYPQDNVEDLLRFAWKLWMDAKPLELIDPILHESYASSEVIRCINIGLLCVQEDVDARPSMASVLNVLNNHSVPLPTPKKPPYFLPKGLAADVSTDMDRSIPMCKDNSLITEINPR